MYDKKKGTKWKRNIKQRARKIYYGGTKNELMKKPGIERKFNRKKNLIKKTYQNMKFIIYVELKFKFTTNFNSRLLRKKIIALMN